MLNIQRWPFALRVGLALAVALASMSFVGAHRDDVGTAIIIGLAWTSGIASGLGRRAEGDDWMSRAVFWIKDNIVRLALIAGVLAATITTTIVANHIGFWMTLVYLWGIAAAVGLVVHEARKRRPERYEPPRVPPKRRAKTRQVGA